MPVSLSRIVVGAHRGGVIARGTAEASRVLNACQKGIFLLPALQNAIRAEAVVCHHQHGNVKVAVRWLDRTEQLIEVDFKSLHPQGADLNDMLAQQLAMPRTIKECSTDLYFSPQAIGGGRYSVDLTDLLSLFPDFSGFRRSSSEAVAMSLVSYERYGPESATRGNLASNKIKRLGLDLYFPMTQGLARQGGVISFSLSINDPEALAEMEKFGARGRFVADFLRLPAFAEDTWENFRAGFLVSSTLGGNSEIVPIWTGRDEVESISQQIAAAYRPWLVTLN